MKEFLNNCISDDLEYIFVWPFMLQVQILIYSISKLLIAGLPESLLLL